MMATTAMQLAIDAFQYLIMQVVLCRNCRELPKVYVHVSISTVGNTTAATKGFAIASSANSLVLFGSRTYVELRLFKLTWGCYSLGQDTGCFSAL
jgi:Na+/H+-translocating membrane pyrophosphatase